MKTKFSTKIFTQFAITITLGILFIEGVLLVKSVQNRRVQLNNIVSVLEADVISKTGKHFHDLHPTILNSADINKRMIEYTKNIIFLAILISLFIVVLTLTILHFYIGRPLGLITVLNHNIVENLKTSNSHKTERFPESKIPKNEIGDLIRSRNILLDEISDYEKNLEDKIDGLKEQIIHSAKLSALGEFSSSIAHDIINPLTVLNFNIIKLKKMIARNELDDLAGQFEKIDFTYDRIESLVIRMRDFGAKNKKKNEEVNILQAVKNSLSLVHHKVENSKVDVSTNIPIEYSIQGDGIALEQVFTNLISNAVDAMNEHFVKSGKIDISAKKEKGCIVLRVRDNGNGIPKANHALIFESFFTTKESGKGTGLGLSNCKAIIEGLGGSISLNSDISKGTEFIITI